MSEGRALINIGELSRPATVLIEKISDALGGVFKPWQIRRVAQANAEAEKISAASRIEITELEQRALGRFLVEEAQKQRNIEAITQQALPLLNEESDPRNVDNDWIANFFDKSRIVSDNEMQILWARILAGEANAPGQYSKRSVNLLSSFDKRDAQLFASLCGFVWDIGGFVPLILGHHEPIYEAGGITFDVLRHLEAIGLVTFQSLAGYAKQLLPEQFVVSYFGSRFMIETGPGTNNRSLWA